MSRKQPICSVGYTWCDASGHIPGGPLWLVDWLPKGYGPGRDDRVVCAFFDTEHRWCRPDYGVRRETLPPLIAAVCKAIEDHLREHPEDIAGHLRYGAELNSATNAADDGSAR